MKLGFFFIFMLFVYAAYSLLWLFYPININASFNAIKIVLFNSRAVYIKCSVCLTRCISLQECMHISTDKLHHCVLSIQRRELLSQWASRHFVVPFWSFHAAHGAIILTEALASVLNTRSMLQLFLYSLPSVVVYFLCILALPELAYTLFCSWLSYSECFKYRMIF